VELHTFDRQLAMTETHHEAVLGFCGDLEHVGTLSRATTREW